MPSIRRCNKTDIQRAWANSLFVENEEELGRGILTYRVTEWRTFDLETREGGVVGEEHCVYGLQGTHLVLPTSHEIRLMFGVSNNLSIRLFDLEQRTTKDEQRTTCR